MYDIERTPEEERAYWDREMMAVEATNRRNEASQATMNAQVGLVQQMAATIRIVDYVILAVTLACIAVGAFDAWKIYELISRVFG